MSSEVFKKFRGKKICVLAVGNTLKGDDGVGIYVGERLTKKKDVRVLMCHTVPENFGLVPSPDEVVFIVDGVKGIRGNYVVTDRISGYEAVSNHCPALNLTYEVLKQRVKDVFLIGVRVGKTGFGEKISEAVKERAEHLLRDMESVWA
jgi:hydrogenase 3 maturation protease